MRAGVWAKAGLEFEKDGVGPPEPDFVRGVAETQPGGDVGAATVGVVFFEHRPVFDELAEHRAQERERHLVGLALEPVASQPFDSNQLQGRPGERGIPLAAADVAAGRQASRRRQEAERRRRRAPGLFG